MMLRSAARCLALALVACPSLAGAETLPIEGSYGDERGCVFARTDDPEDHGEFKLLTHEFVRTFASLCLFQTVQAGADGRFSATASCGNEGEGGDWPESIEIIPNGKNSYNVVFKDGQRWEALARCQ
ncbi:hypothetical protein LJR030_005306 [Rhizobium sp. LjRoot30]|uniref:hypothetical protein n=1 Tax=Rhizobium sp. LjRoot30 TaxID=3342320 RepID=UPI003ECD52B9